MAAPQEGVVSVVIGFALCVARREKRFKHCLFDLVGISVETPPADLRFERLAFVGPRERRDGVLAAPHADFKTAHSVDLDGRGLARIAHVETVAFRTPYGDQIASHLLLSNEPTS